MQPVDAAETPDLPDLPAADARPTPTPDGGSAPDAAPDAAVPTDGPPIPDAYVLPPFPVSIDSSMPECRGMLLPKSNFTVCYNVDRRTADWVSYVVRAADLDGTQPRTNNYRPDPAVPAGERAELVDYQGSGYDRAHLAPADDFTRSHLDMSETFFLTNMTPQLPALNRGQWQVLERYARDLTRRAGVAKIVTGNLTLSSDGTPVDPVTRIGPDGVVVPTHCWKAILVEYPDGHGAALGFVLPNTRVSHWQTYQTTVDKIEDLAGIDLFSELPDDVEGEVEAAQPALP